MLYFALARVGREQADLTGQRLKELGYPYTTVINSTMSRAKETADVVCKHLPHVPREECDLIREGAPIPPEAPRGALEARGQGKVNIDSYQELSPTLEVRFLF